MLKCKIRIWDAETGSRALVVKDVFVPDEWTFVRGGEPSIEESIYQYPSIAYAAQVMAVVNLGLARAALDEVSQMVGGRSSITGASKIIELLNYLKKIREEKHMYKVSLKARNQEFEYQCAPEQTPLKAARDHFIPFPTGCQRGGCGMCKIKVLDGEYEQELIRSHEYLSDEELNNQFALACCMKPKSNLSIITIEDYEEQKWKEASLPIKGQ